MFRFVAFLTTHNRQRRLEIGSLVRGTIVLLSEGGGAAEICFARRKGRVELEKGIRGMSMRE